MEKGMKNKRQSKERQNEREIRTKNKNKETLMIKNELQLCLFLLSFSKSIFMSRVMLIGDIG